MLMKKNIQDVIISLTLLILIFIFYLKLLTMTPLLPGIDGPYYLVQIEYLERHGRLKYSDPPLTFYLMYFFYIILKEPMLSIKVTVALFATLSAVVCYLILRVLTNSLEVAIIGTIIYSSLFYILRLMGGFMKNTVGLLWLNLGILLIILFMKQRIKEKFFIAAYALVVFITGITHVLDFWTLILYSDLIITSWAFSKFNRKKAKILLAVIIVQAVWVTVFTLIPSLMGYDIFKVISFIRAFGKTSPPLHGLHGPPRRPEVNIRILTPTILALIGLASLPIFIKNKVNLSLMVSSSLMLLVLNVLPLPYSLTMRLNLMSSLPSVVIISLITARICKYSFIKVSTLLLIFLLLYRIGVIDHFIPRPSLPPGAYYELKSLIRALDTRGTIFIVPSVKLRYWVETLTENVLIKPVPLFKFKHVYLIIERYGHRPKFIKGYPIFIGRFFIVYKIK